VILTVITSNASKEGTSKMTYIQFLVSPNSPHIPPILDGPGLLGDGDVDIFVRLRPFNGRHSLLWEGVGEHCDSAGKSTINISKRREWERMKRWK
jgi:hypothetical protein